jgi:hypothetical protein
MVTNILRRGVAWRFVALGLFAASLIALFTPPGGNSVAAHTGEAGTWCGSVDLPPVATFVTGWDNPWVVPVSHYHRWDVASDPDPYDHWCYPL